RGRGGTVSGALRCAVAGAELASDAVAHDLYGAVDLARHLCIAVGAKFLDPGTVGLLFMTEIVVGSISAAWLSGEPFGPREMLGVALITGASLLEPLAALVKTRATVNGPN
ncbi:MAG: hypothetical protein ACKVP5_02625, partial [Aestuariivirga sp.]